MTFWLGRPIWASFELDATLNPIQIYLAFIPGLTHIQFYCLSSMEINALCLEWDWPKSTQKRNKYCQSLLLSFESSQSRVWSKLEIRAQRSRTQKCRSKKKVGSTLTLFQWRRGNVILLCFFFGFKSRFKFTIIDSWAILLDDIALEFIFSLW